MVDITGEELEERREGLAHPLIDHRKQLYSKYQQTLEKQEERFQVCIDEMLVILRDHIPVEILVQAVAQLESIQLRLVTDKLSENKFFTKNQIVVYFLAILDNLLGLVYEKLTQTHFNLLRLNVTGLNYGKTFSYPHMKKIQMKLIQEGYIMRVRSLCYTLKLKDKFCQIVSHIFGLYPKFTEKLREIEITGYSLIHTKSIPKLEPTKAAAVVLGLLVQCYFKEKKNQDLIWCFLEEITRENKKQMMRKVYRFKAKLKQEGKIDLLFKSEEDNVKNSNDTRYTQDKLVLFFE